MSKGVITAFAKGLRAHDLSFDGELAINYGPVAPVRSGVSIGFDATASVGTLDQTLRLGTAADPVAIIHADHMVSHVNSPGMGIDLLRATSDVSVDHLTFSLMASAQPQAVLGLKLSADFIHSSSTASKVFGGPHAFLNGATSFGSLNVTGLASGPLSFTGDAAPNTVLFASDALTITLNKTDLLPSQNGSTTMRTEAIDVHFAAMSMLGGKISGDLLIGETYAAINPQI